MRFPFSHQIDSMLALQTIHIRRDIQCKLLYRRGRTGRHLYLTQFASFPCSVVPRTIYPHTHLEAILHQRSQEDTELSLISFASTRKSLESQFIFFEPTKSKILITNDITMFHVGTRSMVIPNIPRVLHGLPITQIASISG